MQASYLKQYFITGKQPELKIDLSTNVAQVRMTSIYLNIFSKANLSK